MSYTRTRGTRVAAAVGATIGALTIAAGLVLVASRADAVLSPVPETGATGQLVLAADPYPFEDFTIAPGDPALWLVEARLEEAATAVLALEVRKSGEIAEHPHGLRMTVESCTVAWEGYPDAPTCAGTRTVIVDADPTLDHATTSPEYRLGVLRNDQPRQLLVTLAIADDADESAMGLVGSVGIGLTATAADAPLRRTINGTPTGAGGSSASGSSGVASSATSGSLAASGPGDLGAWLLPGIALIAVGIAEIIATSRIARRSAMKGGAR